MNQICYTFTVVVDKNLPGEIYNYLALYTTTSVKYLTEKAETMSEWVYNSIGMQSTKSMQSMHSMYVYSSLVYSSLLIEEIVVVVVFFVFFVFFVLITGRRIYTNRMKDKCNKEIDQIMQTIAEEIRRDKDQITDHIISEFNEQKKLHNGQVVEEEKEKDSVVEIICSGCKFCWVDKSHSKHHINNDDHSNDPVYDPKDSENDSENDSEDEHEEERIAKALSKKGREGVLSEFYVRKPVVKTVKTVKFKTNK